MIPYMRIISSILRISSSTVRRAGTVSSDIDLNSISTFSSIAEVNISLSFSLSSMLSLQERISLIDESANIIISDLYSKYRIGWAKISGTVRNKYIATNLTPREHEIAKLSVFGFNVKEISNMLFISESTVKQTISRVIAKTGIEEKSQFVYII